jgi:acetylornithine deacetylase/succinyl-diaminopimelate desuccinylase-like protein
MNINIKYVVQQYSKACADEQLDLLRTLGKIPSPSHQEDKRVSFCYEWFIKQGFTDVTIDCAKNVICKVNCNEYNDLIVFAAHTDIVFPSLDTLPMEEHDGKLYAPGIGDDTANLVNLMIAAKYLKNRTVKPNYGFLIVANSCEEGLGNLDGVKQLFLTFGDRIKAFYSFDGYTPQCCNNGVGSYRYKITCNTNGGHSYINFGEPNAIEILCDLISNLYRIKPPSEVKTTYNVGRIEGGSTVNSIPQEAYMLYEFRSTSQECLLKMESEFNKTIEMSKGKGGKLTVDLLGIRPGNGKLDKRALDEFTAMSAGVISNFYSGDIDYAAYSTDSNIPLSRGIVANTIGTVTGDLAHTREEWMNIDSLSTGVKIVLSLILSYTNYND